MPVQRCASGEHFHVPRFVCALQRQQLRHLAVVWVDLPEVARRHEQRGVGGIFFDDFSELGMAQSLAMLQSVGDALLPAYMPIVERRKDTPYGERERDFQLYRRGRYVEFNLVWDRGTHFGLQSGGRTESILLSMPPEVRWSYQRKDPVGSPEERLLSHFLVPRDWV